MTAERVLMIAFHLPPSAISSGHLRPLGFARHLPGLGWEPVFLSANPRAYPRTDAASVALIPAGTPVLRAFALDAKRHLSIGGRYPDLLAQPDRWTSWWPAAVVQGLRLIRRYHVQAIWSTYPIMTAHWVAETLARMTGLPWIADFRDPVPSSVATQTKLTKSSQMRLERRVISRARYVVFTTPGAMQSCASRFPAIAGAGRLKVVPNGFDEPDFAGLPAYQGHETERPVHLVHSGVLYPQGRDPKPFFQALARLCDSGAVRPDDVRVTLRASDLSANYAMEIRRLGLDGVVTLAPPMSYRDALAEQALADGLLLFQGEEFDHQIPAKAYEYLRAGRPIFALVGERGDTAALLRESGNAVLVPPADVETIAGRLAEFVRAARVPTRGGGDAAFVARHSRQAGAALLAGLLDAAVMPCVPQ